MLLPRSNSFLINLFVYTLFKRRKVELEISFEDYYSGN